MVAFLYPEGFVLTSQLPEPDYDPAKGSVGYLTWDEYDRLTRAFTDALKHVSWWRIAGHIRIGDPDEHRTRSQEPTIPIPATWLAAEEISRLMGELNRWPNLEDAVNTLDGQFFATLLIREVETAMHKWPMSDKPHKVRYVRCRACQQQTLKYFPPNLRAPRDAVMTVAAVKVRGRKKPVPIELADVTVRCTNKECGAVEDPAMFARDALLIRLEAERAKTMADRRRGSGDNRPDSEGDLSVGEGGSDRVETTGRSLVAVPE